MSTQHALQVLVFIVTLAGIGMTVVYVRRYPKNWIYTTPPLSWLLALVIFYSLIFLRDFAGVSMQVDFTLWSAVLRLQAAFLILGVMTLLAYERLLFKS